MSDQEMSEAEVMDLIGLLVGQRYPGYDEMDFLAAYSEGRADDLFPGSDDIVVLAEALGSV